MFSLRSVCGFAVAAAALAATASVSLAAAPVQKNCGAMGREPVAMLSAKGVKNKVQFSSIAFTDSKGHYHPDWYFASLPTSNKRPGLPMTQVEPYALTGHVARTPVDRALFTDSKGHYHPDWAIHGRP